MKVTAILSIIAAIIAAIVLTFVATTYYVHVDAGDIVVVQKPMSGDLVVYTQPGWQKRYSGSYEVYKKREQLYFDPKQNTEPLRIRFNDGAHATMVGSISWSMPQDENSIKRIHTDYRSFKNIEQQIILTVLGKSVYTTGPLMSSAESYASRRNDLLALIADQVENGVYKTLSKDVFIKDELSDKEKSKKIVELVPDPKARGGFAREDESPCTVYNIKTANLSLNEITYDGPVEAQIQNQQQSIMAVQTAIAKAKTAQQDAITAEQTGMAEAAKAKWAQEVIKATEVTKGQQEVQVATLKAQAIYTNAVISAQQKLAEATLDAQTAEQRKREATLMGEGEGAKRAAIIAADGALQQKLDALVKINTAYAQALKGAQIVPSVVLGGGGTSTGTAGNSAQQLIDLLTANTAKQLSLDMSIKK